MQQKLSDLLFHPPQIFFGSLDHEAMEDHEIDLDWGLVFDIPQVPSVSSTGLFLHYPQQLFTEQESQEAEYY